MVDEQLVNWLKESQSMGYSADYLKDYLAKQGYSESDINDAMSSIQPIKPLPVQKTEKKDEKKRKKYLFWLIGAILLILLLLFALWILWPSQQAQPAPAQQAPLPAPQAEINTTLPETYSSMARVTADVTLTEKSNRDKYSVVLVSANKVDEENNSYSSMNLQGSSADLSNPISIAMETYIIKPDTYVKVDSDIIKQWLKITPDSPAGMLNNLGIDPETTQHLFDASQQNKLVNTGQVAFLNDEKTHIQVILSNETLGELAKMFFTLVTTLDPELKQKYNIERYTPIYAKAFRSTSFEFWLDKDRRLANGTMDFTMVFDGSNLIPDPGYNPVTIDFNGHVDLKAYDYGKPVSIVLPAEARNAMSVEDFSRSMMSAGGLSF